MSRKATKEKFLRLFDCDMLPNFAELSLFLKKNGLGGFVDRHVKEARFENENKENFIFCLPVSEAESNDFNEKLDTYLKKHDVKMILYWMQQAVSDDLDPPCYDAWRIEITRAGKAANRVAAGDLYWAALNLLISFVENDIPSYATRFEPWQENNPRISTRLLRSISCIHYVFFAEQALTILKMDWPRKNTLDRFLSRTHQFQLITFLKIAAASFYFFYNQDYKLLAHLPLALALQTFTSWITDTNHDIIRTFLFLSCQLLSTGFYTAVQLYSVTLGDSPHRTTLSEWTAIMAKEIIKIPIFIVGMFVFSILISLAEKLLLQQWTKSKRNQSGFRAMGFLSVQFFLMSFIEEKWTLARSAESFILAVMRIACEKNSCESTIQNSGIDRSMQQTLFRQQTLVVENKGNETITTCEANITHSKLSHCDYFDVSCRTTNFSSSPLNESRSLSAPLFTKGEYIRCEPNVTNDQPKGFWHGFSGI